MAPTCLNSAYCLWGIFTSPECIFVNNTLRWKVNLFTDCFLLAADHSSFLILYSVQIAIRRHPFTVIIQPNTSCFEKHTHKKENADWLSLHLQLWSWQISLLVRPYDMNTASDDIVDVVMSFTVILQSVPLFSHKQSEKVEISSLFLGGRTLWLHLTKSWQDSW